MLIDSKNVKKKNWNLSLPLLCTRQDISKYDQNSHEQLSTQSFKKIGRLLEGMVTYGPTNKILMDDYQPNRLRELGDYRRT
jgi:hypothetical protein